MDGLRNLGRAEGAGPIAQLSLDLSRRLAARSVADLLADLGPVLADLSVQEAALRIPTAHHATGQP